MADWRHFRIGEHGHDHSGMRWCGEHQVDWPVPSPGSGWPKTAFFPFPPHISPFTSIKCLKTRLLRSTDGRVRFPPVRLGKNEGTVPEGGNFHNADFQKFPVLYGNRTAAYLVRWDLGLIEANSAIRKIPDFPHLIPGTPQFFPLLRDFSRIFLPKSNDKKYQNVY